MQLTLKETGAVGSPSERRLNTETLSAEDSRAIERSVDDAEFFYLPDRFTPMRPDRSAPETELTVEDGDQRHTVKLEAGAEQPDFIMDILSLFNAAWRKVSGN